MAERIQGAVRRLAAGRPADQVTLAEAAASPGVRWTTVRRPVGGKAGLKKLVEEEQAANGAAGPGTRDRVIPVTAQVFGQKGYAGAMAKGQLEPGGAYTRDTSAGAGGPGLPVLEHATRRGGPSLKGRPFSGRIRALGFQQLL